jgi:hypothetical protein
MNSEPIKCPNPDCLAAIGEAVNIDGLVMLRVGALLIRDAQGVCMQCGRVFYWSVSNKVIAHVIRLALIKGL